MTVFYQDSQITLYQADVMDGLSHLGDESVQCVVTSPPYWGLRDYGVAGQIGLEKTPEEYIDKMVTLFREARRVLKQDGTLWLNLGDCYSSSNGGYYCNPDHHTTLVGGRPESHKRPALKTLPAKNLLGIPWRVALALQADGYAEQILCR